MADCSGCGPAAVEHEGRAGDGGGAGAAEEGDHLGHLLGFDETLDGSAGEQDVVEDLVLVDPVGDGLVGELTFDQRGADVAGADGVAGDSLSAPSRAITLESPSRPCLALT